MTMQDFIVVGAGTIFLFVLFIVIGYVREYGAGDLWGVLRRYVEVRMTVPPQVGSNSEPASAASRDPLPPHGNQAGSDIDGDREAAPRQLSRVDLIVMLAVQRNDAGEYLWSSNEIKKFVGGRAEVVGETIATVRGKKEQPPPGAPLRRPVNGW